MVRDMHTKEGMLHLIIGGVGRIRVCVVEGVPVQHSYMFPVHVHGIGLASKVITYWLFGRGAQVCVCV